jgi:hypothetical protein
MQYPEVDVKYVFLMKDKTQLKDEFFILVSNNRVPINYSNTYQNKY